MRGLKTLLPTENCSRAARGALLRNGKRPRCRCPFEKMAVSICRPVLLAALLGSPAFAAPLKYERTVLPGGAVLLVSEQRSVPMVVVQVTVDAGSRRDPRGKEGLANLTADLLTEGTETRSATQISDAVDFIGASLSTAAGVDTASLGLTVVRKHLETGLDLLADVLLRPSFPHDEVERRRDAVLASMKASEDQPGHVATRAFVEMLFDNEPYGHLSQGTAAGVKAISRADVVNFYRRHYHLERAIIAVAGDIGAAEAAALFERFVAERKPGAAPAFAYPERGARTAAVARIQRPVTQANVILGHQGIARKDPDYYAIEVMNYILGGGGFGSRLLDRIRTKEGLAYSVASGFTAPQFRGSFRIVLQTKNESVGEAIALACEEIDRIRREPVTEDELSGAQLYLTGSFPLQVDSNSKIASFLTDVEFFALGADYADTYAERIRAVTADDVLRVARKHLRPEEAILVVVADFNVAKVDETRPCRSAPPDPTPSRTTASRTPGERKD